MGTLNDCYRHAETRREYWTAGLGPIVANRLESGLLDIPSYRSTSIMNSELAFTDGAGTTADGVYRRWRTYPAIYGDFVDVFRKAQAETLPPHRSIAINLQPGYNLPYGRIYNFSELGGAIFTQLCGLRSRAHEPGSWIWIWT